MRVLVVGAAAVLLTLWAYGSTWSAGWVYEDRATRTSALSAVGWQRAVTNWTWRFTETPRQAHALGLVLHLTISAMLGVVAWRLGLTPFGAWVVALLWLGHPIAVETAAYAKARSEQIVLLGVLLAMSAAAGRWWRPLGLVGVLCGTLLAIGGEPSGVVVLLVVPLTIWHGRTQNAADRPRWASWWPPAVVAAALIVAGVVWYGGLRAVINADEEAGLVSASAVTWQQWGLAQAGAVWYWLLASVWPALITPDVDVDRLPLLTRWCGVAAMVGAAMLAWRSRQRRPMTTVALCLCLCAVLPRLLVQTPRSYLNAAQFALPFMGLALLAGYGTERLRARWVS